MSSLVQLFPLLVDVLMPFLYILEVCHYCFETTSTSHIRIQGLFLSFVSIPQVRVLWMTATTIFNMFRILLSLPMLI